MGDLYDSDVLAWSEHQARLLRQHAAGKPGLEAHAGVVGPPAVFAGPHDVPGRIG